MNRGRLATMVLLASAAVIALVAFGILDARVHFGTRDAEAIDLFGNEEKQTQEEKAEAAEHAKTALRIAREMLEAYARVARDRSDLGAIATMTEYVYRALKQKAEALSSP